MTAGQGRGVVVATGAHTEVARIAGLAATARPPRTPLQQHLGQLAGWLLWLALGFSLLVPVLSVLLVGCPWREALLEGLTLAFATIPEELPVLITIVLGVGASRLAPERAIVKRLQAAETLGSVSVIGTDKTGTLTENRMHVVELFVDDARHPASDAAGPTVTRLLTVGALATEAHVTVADGRVRLLDAARDTDVQPELPSTEEAHRHLWEEMPVDELRTRAGVHVELPRGYEFDELAESQYLAWTIENQIRPAVSQRIANWYADKMILGGGEVGAADEQEFREFVKGDLPDAQAELLLRWHREEVRGEGGAASPSPAPQTKHWRVLMAEGASQDDVKAALLREGPPQRKPLFRWPA